MFKGNKRLDASATDTLIGEGSVFEGNIRSEASLRIEGELIGDIDCKGDVTIGESGKATSNINARNVVIAGSVHGNVVTSGVLTLTGTAKLYGNTSARSLVIAEGALFHGSSRMEGAAGVPSSQAAAEQDAGNVDSTAYAAAPNPSGSTAV